MRATYMYALGLPESRTPPLANQWLAITVSFNYNSLVTTYICNMARVLLFRGAYAIYQIQGIRDVGHRIFDCGRVKVDHDTCE
jgi:hypothetical protein